VDKYTPNSHKYKEEQANKKEIKKVVSGTVKTKKKSEIRKLSDVFISEDAANVKNYIFFDVLVPAIKNAIIDIATDSVTMIFGGSRRRNGINYSNPSKSSYISYNKYSDRRDDRRYDDSRSRTGYSYDDIILETRGDAEEVLDQMESLIDTYGMVSVADMYDLVGKSCNYTDNKYGWTNLRNAEPIRMRDGYMLKLPKAGPLKD
jgi:hypothetical protein